MRAMGPGSLSSFLKTVLDVIYFALIGILGLMLLSAVGGVLSYSFWPENSFTWLQDAAAQLGVKESMSGGELFAVLGVSLLYALFYIAALIAILSRLRLIFTTLTAGDPFQPENIRRLQPIGFILAGMEVGRYLLKAVLVAIAPEVTWKIDGFNITAWLAVLVVFVLAEVFREGARLRREAELTI
jgi:hypothetical protein